jgi:hypothetical protein
LHSARSFFALLPGKQKAPRLYFCQQVQILRWLWCYGVGFFLGIVGWVFVVGMFEEK